MNAKFPLFFYCQGRDTGTWEKIGLILTGIALSGLALFCIMPTREQPVTGVRIGVNLDLTGPAAVYDVSTARGITLAIDDINAAGGLLGQPVEQIVKNNESQHDLAMTQLKELSAQRETAVLGPNITATALAVAPLAESMHLPLISPAGTHPDITVSATSYHVYSYIFRATYIDSYQGRVMADFARQTLGAKTSAVIYDAHSSYSQGLAEFYRKAFTVRGGTVPLFIGLEKKEDLAQAMALIKQQPVDAVYAPFYGEGAEACLVARYDEGLMMPFLGGDGWHGMRLAQHVDPAYVENVYYADHYSYGTDSDKARDFAEKYYAAYGQWPDSYAALGYDAAMMVAAAVRQSHSNKPEAVAEALRKTVQFPGVTGTFSIDGNHDAITPVYIIHFVDGQPALYQTIQPTT